MSEVNLLGDVPKSSKIAEKGWRTEKNREIAKRFDREFFDGERVNGYGGYFYDGRWRTVVSKMQGLYRIDSNSSVLDVGCAKGFLLYDLQDMIPGIHIAGIDISEYAVSHAMQGYANYLIKKTKEYYYVNNADWLETIAGRKILPHMILGSAERLPWADDSFDVVFSNDTIHNLPEEQCIQAIEEMMRVCRPEGYTFIKVDAYRNEQEKERMENWVLTAKTAKHVNDWLKLFEEIGYTGDYSWTLF